MSIFRAPCEDKYRKQFFLFHQIDILEIKHFVRCEVWRFTKASSTDQLEVMRDRNEGGWICRE